MARRFAYELILGARPDLAFDLEELPLALVTYGSIDEISVELEAMGSGSALKIRTDGLLQFARQIDETKDLSVYGRNLAMRFDFLIGVWMGLLSAHCVCERYIPNDAEASEAIRCGELWLQGHLPSDRGVTAWLRSDRERYSYQSFSERNARSAASEIVHATVIAESKPSMENLRLASDAVQMTIARSLWSLSATPSAADIETIRSFIRENIAGMPMRETPLPQILREL